MGGGKLQSVGKENKTTLYFKNFIMSVKEIINANANVQLVVSLMDLKELFHEWQEEYCKAKESVYKEEYLTTDEVAKKLNCDPSTLWRWDKNGYLPKVKWCGKARYRLSDVQRIMEG